MECIMVHRHNECHTEPGVRTSISTKLLKFSHRYIEGILPKGPYLPCVSMAGRALLAGYHRYTVQCRYNAVNFLSNPHKIHPIAHPLGRGMGCILWLQTVIYTLPQSPQWCMQYHVTLDLVIMALDSIRSHTKTYTTHAIMCHRWTQIEHYSGSSYQGSTLNEFFYRPMLQARAKLNQSLIISVLFSSFIQYKCMASAYYNLLVLADSILSHMRSNVQ